MPEIMLKEHEKTSFLAVVAVSTVGYVQEQGVSIAGLPLSTQSADNTLQNAYNNRQSDLQVQGEGFVTKLLPEISKAQDSEDSF